MRRNLEPEEGSLLPVMYGIQEVHNRMHHLNRYYFQVLTTVSARCCLIGSRTSGLRGFHLSQRSGSEVTLQFHSAARASESSSHHTNCSSSAGWEGKGKPPVSSQSLSALEFRATLNAVFQSTRERSVLVKRFRACGGVVLGDGTDPVAGKQEPQRLQLAQVHGGGLQAEPQVSGQLLAEALLHLRLPGDRGRTSHNML